MGVKISTPNFNRRRDQLCLPPEIIEDGISKYLSFGDLLVCRLVCKDFYQFINYHEMLSTSSIIMIEKTESPLLSVFSNASLDEDVQNLIFRSFSLIDLDIEHSWSFWTVYQHQITSLVLKDCTFLWKTTTVRVSTCDDSENDGQFTPRIGLPNLRHLGLVGMDKYFMMGGAHAKVHRIFYLEKLESLDLSSNMYLTDDIVFNILWRTSRLRSLNLSNSQIVFSHAVFKRYYPITQNQLYSDAIFSFEMLMQDFVKSEKGKYLSEIMLNETLVNSLGLSLLNEKNWECVEFKCCTELKKKDYISFLETQCSHIKKLIFGGSTTKLTSEILCKNEYPHLETLCVKGCPEVKNLNFLCNMLRLQELDLDTTMLDDNTGLSVLLKLKKLNYTRVSLPFQLTCHFSNITHLDISRCEWVDDEFLQNVVKYMRKMRNLQIAHLYLITDAGTKDLNKLTSLRVLNLQGCRGLGEMTWCSAIRFVDLVNLDIRSCPNLNMEGLLSICNNCRNLEKLLVDSNVEFNERVIDFISPKLCRIREIKY